MNEKDRKDAYETLCDLRSAYALATTGVSLRGGAGAHRRIITLMDKLEEKLNPTKYDAFGTATAQAPSKPLEPNT